MSGRWRQGAPKPLPCVAGRSALTLANQGRRLTTESKSSALRTRMHIDIDDGRLAACLCAF